MKKTKKHFSLRKKLLPLSLSISLLASTPGLALGAVDGYVTLGKDQKTYSYTYKDLLTSLKAELIDPADSQAALWQHFTTNKQGILALHDDKNGYISYDDVKKALVNSIVNETPFTVNSYTESAAAKKTELPAILTQVAQGPTGVVFNELSMAAPGIPSYTVTVAGTGLFGTKSVTVKLNTTNITQYKVTVDGSLLKYSSTKDVFIGVLETTKSDDELKAAVKVVDLGATPTFTLTAIANGLMGSKSVTVKLNTTDSSSFKVTVDGTPLTYSTTKAAFVGVIDTAKTEAELQALTVITGTSDTPATPVTLKELSPVTIKITPDEPDTLPTTVEGIMNDGSKKPLTVTWITTPVDTSKMGTTIIYGTVAESATLKAQATIEVGPPSGTVTTEPSALLGLTQVTVKLNTTKVSEYKVTVDGTPLEYSAQKGLFLVIMNTEKTTAQLQALTVVTKIDPTTIPVTVKGVQPVEVITAAGTAPVLPATLTAVMSDGSSKTVNVAWPALTTDQYASAKIFKVYGSISESTSIKPVATVTVTASSAFYTLTATDSGTGSKTVKVVLNTTDDNLYTVTVDGTSLTYSAALDAFTGVLATSKTPAELTAATIIVLKPVTASVVSLESVNVMTVAGTAPVFPTTVLATMSDGFAKKVSVMWETPVAPQYASPTTFIVYGTPSVPSAVKATAYVTVTLSMPSFTLTSEPSPITGLKTVKVTIQAADVSKYKVSVEGKTLNYSVATNTFIGLVQTDKTDAELRAQTVITQ